MRKRHYRVLVTGLLLAGPMVVVSAGSAGASGRPQATAAVVPTLRANYPAPAGLRPRPATAMALRVPDPAVYAAQKAAANAAAARFAAGRRAAARRRPGLRAAPLVPSLPRNWAGLSDSTDAPSDSTGAIGTARYIELVNAKVAIYTRTSNSPTATGSLIALTGCATTLCTDSVFDVQVNWDPATNRFYYATDDIASSTQNFIDFGFSTSATPTLSMTSWCRYSLPFGSKFPDYPKLGDTKDFALVGYNEFSGNGSGAIFIGSHISWVSKPPAGSTCPAPSTFKTGTSLTLKNANGANAFTPVPSSQADPNSTGWAVARPATIPSGGATFLTLFKVTKSTTGTAIIPATGTAVPVAAYKVPASAPQPGTGFKLDTLDARNTQAQLAVDPSHGGVTALWTQHAVFGGAGSQVRWYEINPATHSLIQSGTLSSGSLFTFDGAISSDRRVNGSSAKFGADLVIHVVQSSTTVLPTIKVASKVGSNPISALVQVATSASADTGFDCMNSANLCRWGDYAAATPDPASATTGTTGEVWGSSMLGAAGGGIASSGWTTQNFAIKP
jgi:hypothetical protein